MRTLRWITAPKVLLDGMRPVRCRAFETELSDGSFIVTVEEFPNEFIEEHPAIDREFHPKGTPAGQLLARHRERLAARLAADGGLQAVPVSGIDGALALQDRLQALRSAHRAAIGWVTLEELTGMLAERSALAFPIFMEMQRLTQATPAASTGGPQRPLPDPAALERAAFLAQLEDKPPVEPSARSRWMVTGLTAMAFVAVASAMFSLEVALILLAVIGLHEGGHFLAMLACGYRHLKVFFIPGLGGLASGRKEAVPAWQSVLIYLAGPVPGIVLGLCGLALMPFVSGDSVWRSPLDSFVRMSLLINYLNLLPLVPLDGGRVVERLLFTRWPRVRFVFALLSLLALVAAAWAFADRALVVICVLIGLGLPFQRRMSRLLSTYLERFGPLRVSRRETIERLYGLQVQAGAAPGTFAQRVETAKAALLALQDPLPRWRDTLAGLGLYAALMLGAPAAVLVVLFHSSGPGPSAAEIHRRGEGEAARAAAERSANLAAATSDQQRWEIHLKSSAALAPSSPQAREALDAAWAIAETWPAGDTRRLQTLIVRSRRLTGDQADSTALEQSARLRQQVRDEMARTPGLDPEQRALLGHELYQSAPHEDPHREADLEAALAALVVPGPPSDLAYLIRAELARLRYAQARLEDAEGLLMQNYRDGLAGWRGDASPASRTGEHYQAMQAAAEIGLIRVDRGQAREAFDFSNRAAVDLSRAQEALSLPFELARADAAAASGDWSAALAILDRAEQGPPSTPFIMRVMRWAMSKGGDQERRAPVPLQVQRLDVFARSQDGRADALARQLRLEFQAWSHWRETYCLRAPSDRKTWGADRARRLQQSLSAAGVCPAEQREAS